jgi:hypothetical protein
MSDVCKEAKGSHQGGASGSLLLDLDGLEVVAAELVDAEWQLAVQTTDTVVGCVGCGLRASPHGRHVVQVRDLPIGGRPVVLWWSKRIWRCREPACKVQTWTERVAGIAPRAVLTQRARAEACRRVGKDAHAVAAVARDLGVGWATIMWAVVDHGIPLAEDRGRPAHGLLVAGVPGDEPRLNSPRSLRGRLPLGHRPGSGRVAGS